MSLPTTQDRPMMEFGPLRLMTLSVRLIVAIPLLSANMLPKSPTCLQQEAKRSQMAASKKN